MSLNYKIRLFADDADKAQIVQGLGNPLIRGIGIAAAHLRDLCVLASSWSLDADMGVS